MIHDPTKKYQYPVKLKKEIHRKQSKELREMSNSLIIEFDLRPTKYSEDKRLFINLANLQQADVLNVERMGHFERRLESAFIDKTITENTEQTNFEYNSKSHLQSMWLIIDYDNYRQIKSWKWLKTQSKILGTGIVLLTRAVTERLDRSKMTTSFTSGKLRRNSQ